MTMRRCWPAATLGALLAWALPVFAHGGGHSPYPPPPAAPPNSLTPPLPRTPFDPPPPSPPTPPTKPPPPTPDKHDANPTTPGPPQAPKPTPPPTKPPPTRPIRPGYNPMRTGQVVSTANSWRVWWEYNREYLLGVRARIRRAATVTTTGPTTGRAADPLDGKRAAVRTALRVLIERPTTPVKLKSAAMIALGRIGSPGEAGLYFDALRSNADDDVRAAAALGLGLLPPFEDAAMRERVRGSLDHAVAKGSRRVRGFAFIATGLRARHDRSLAMSLARYGQARITDDYDAAALAFACGISRNEALLPELLMAGRHSTLGGAKLDDVGRAHAAAGLGHMKSGLAADMLVKLLTSRKAGIHTRRAAALGLGRLLREAELPAGQDKAARTALTRTAEKGRDSILQGYALIALGGARAPTGTGRMMREVDHGGNATTKTYAALALGLAAPRLSAREARRVRTFLVEQLAGTKEVELGSALAIACGLAEATDAIDVLAVRVGKKSRPPLLRGSSAEALGLLGSRDKRSEDVLLDALRNGPTQLVEDAALGLGMLGRAGVVPELIKRLERTSSRTLQGRLTLALGYLGHSAAVEPLLEIVGDPGRARSVRDLAAVALGLLGAGDHDALADLDAYYNYFATTIVTRELLMIL